MSIDAQDETGRRRGVDAVETVAAILQALVLEGGSARLRDIAARSGISRPKVHRYLVSMVGSGLAERAADGMAYRLGLLARRIGRVADDKGSLATAILPAVTDFAERHGLTCGIAQFANGVVTAPHWVVPSREFAIAPRRGTALTFALTTSSTGKLFGAFLPEISIRPLIEAELAADGTCGLADRRRQVEAVLADVRRIGLASGVGPRVKGINALSVPVFDDTGALAAGITAIGHESAIDVHPDSAFARTLVDLGASLTRRLGGSPPGPLLR